MLAANVLQTDVFTSIRVKHTVQTFVQISRSHYMFVSWLSYQEMLVEPEDWQASDWSPRLCFNIYKCDTTEYFKETFGQTEYFYGEFQTSPGVLVVTKLGILSQYMIFSSP